jgi:thiosulfate dehydrogenase (quinone) large subunit
MGIHTRARRRPPLAVAAGWRVQPVALRILRAFLGVTFVYAGIQKLADPGFLHPGTRDYIGLQLAAFAQGSPIGFLLRALAHVPVLTGLAIAFLEIAIGVCTLLGVAPFVSAFAGLAVNVALFLSATWHVHPYFLGSDSMYAVAWLAFIAGMWDIERRRRRGTPAGRQSGMVSTAMSRRELLRGGIVAAATFLLAGVGRALTGSTSPASGKALGPTGILTPHATPPSHPSPTPTAGHHTPRPLNGQPIASLGRLPVGSAAAFTGPAGEPAVVVRLANERVAAFSRVCTHAGCIVGWDPNARLLFCPCHGAEFDPAHGAKPVTGPALTPLPSIHVAIDHPSGEVIIPRSA